MRDGIQVKVKLFTLGRGDLTDADQREEFRNRLEDFILADPLVIKLYGRRVSTLLSVKEKAGK